MHSVKAFFLSVIISVNGYGAVLTVEPGTGTYPTIGDANAAAFPGDTVLVRGGIYRESVRLRQNGSADAYTTFRAYPGETAILDGSIILQGWTPCASAAECGGNPHWRNIYRCAPGRPVRLLSDNLFEGEKMLNRARRPAAADTFFDRSPDGMRLIPAGGLTATTLSDPEFFTQTEDGYWVGGDIILFTGNDTLYTRRITAYSAAEHMVTFDAIPGVAIEYGKDRYALSNHIMLVDGPGGYYGDEDNDVYYLWPFSQASLDTEITITTRTKGFVVDGQYIRVEGFVIRRFYDNAVYADGARDFVFENNEVLQVLAKDREPAVKFATCINCLAENNRLHHNRYGAGLMFSGGSANTARGNLLDMNGGSGIMFHGTTNSGITGNAVLNHRGMGAYGISGVGNLTLSITGNYVRSGSTALLFQQASNIIIKNNFFHADGWAAACLNSGATPQVTFSFNTMVSDTRYAFHSEPGAISNLVLMNNIVQGMPASMKTGSYGYNLFIDVAGYNPGLGTGEILTDYAGVFNDPANFDHRPAAGSPAVDAGGGAVIDDDITGAPRPYNAVYDIGAWEYRGVSADTDRPEIRTITTGLDAPGKVVVAFSEALAPLWARAVSCYALSGGAVAARADISADSTTVTLTTSKLTDGQTYYLTVNYIRDAAGNTVAANTTVSFTCPGVSSTGDAAGPATVVPDITGSGMMFDITGRSVPAAGGHRSGIYLVPADGAVKKMMIIQ